MAADIVRAAWTLRRGITKLLHAAAHERPAIHRACAGLASSLIAKTFPAILTAVYIARTTGKPASPVLQHGVDMV
jgi:hypothetical protein